MHFSEVNLPSFEQDLIGSEGRPGDSATEKYSSIAEALGLLLSSGTKF